jgi:hypothetical protein
MVVRAAKRLTPRIQFERMSRERRLVAHVHSHKIAASRMDGLNVAPERKHALGVERPRALL